MGFNEEKYKKDQKHYDNKVYRTQKVKMYRLKHWIFDFGGVMVEGAHIYNRVIAKMNEDLGISISKSTPHVRKWRRMLSSGRLTGKKFLQNLIMEFHPSRNPKEIDVQPYLDFWFQKYSELIQLTPEMEEVVERLHKAGYTVSLMSNTIHIHARSNELKGFFDLFDHVFLSNELKMRKPDTEKYKYVLEKLNAKPKETIFIDDKLINLVPATKLGINVIMFISFESFQNYLSDLGIEKIDRESRDNILRHYKIYKTSKKEYKKAKKSVKSVNKELKKIIKKGHSATYRRIQRKLEKELRFRKLVYNKKKADFKKQKLVKKEILEPKLKMSHEDSK